MFAAFLLGGFALALTPTSAGASAPLTESSVTVQVVDMSPTTATGTAKPAPLTITVALTNTTGQALRGVQLSAQREAPISQQSQLDQLMAHPTAGDPNGVQPMHASRSRRSGGTCVRSGDLSRHDQHGRIGRRHLPQCLTGVYPIDFSVTATGTDGVSTQVGFGQTYLPYFQSQPEPVRISWVWPLIDRPHRLDDDIVFTDNALPATVATGGRLDRMLRVAEQVAPNVRLSLVVDADLLDELAVMASGKYDVLVGGKRVAGTDGRVAQAWLARLRALLPRVDLHITPPSDPDVQAIVRQRLPWTATLSDGASTRVAAALGVPSLAPFGDVYWAAGGTTTPQALSSVVDHGASALILDDTAFASDASRLSAARRVTTSPRPGVSGPVRGGGD